VLGTSRAIGFTCRAMTIPSPRSTRSSKLPRVFFASNAPTSACFGRHGGAAKRARSRVMAGGQSMRFEWRRFADFSASELYDVLAFRQDVFIVEQNSVYRDLDFLDQLADHLVATSEEGRLSGYLRCLGPPSGMRDASFGRVVVAAAARGTGLGRELVSRAVERLRRQHSGADIVIGAQAHLEPFYASFGFAREGELYDDGGVPHYHMRLRAAPR
jgi:ElaA protein